MMASMDLEQALNRLYEGLQETDAYKFVVYGIEEKILQNLNQNFQVSNLSSLRTRKESKSQVDIENVGSFEFGSDVQLADLQASSNSNRVFFKIERSGLQQLQDYSRVIYLESPIYWKLKSALENVRISPRFFHYQSRERISGVPGYFYDLASSLREKYSGEIAFPELYEKLISKEVMGGKITISENGELNFQENGRSFPLHLTAMGIINLGILALLIERKILDKGTFLFIDEPEAHLHPAWQVIMAESLFELSRQGVNVVIATHSADILKWLEVHVKRNPNDESLVALNKFSVNGVETGEQDFNYKIAAIKQELTKPFADLYTAGL